MTLLRIKLTSLAVTFGLAALAAIVPATASRSETGAPQPVIAPHAPASSGVATAAPTLSATLTTAAVAGIAREALVPGDDRDGGERYRDAGSHPPLVLDEEGEPSLPVSAMREPPPTTGELCAMLEAEANVRALPSTFFVRLIWQESRFDITAVSPKGAQGIAQFMPATAAERGLDDPFDPVAALGASAELLAELTEAFGNVGLAAAAYNAGPGRVQRWLDGEATLPRETIAYVRIVTGMDAEAWKDPAAVLPAAVHEVAGSVQDWCRALPRRGLERVPIIEAKAQSKSDTAADAPPLGVQLAARLSQAEADAVLARLMARHGEVLAPHASRILKRPLSQDDEQPLYEVRIALDSKDAADALCAALRRKGEPCEVAFD